MKATQLDRTNGILYPEDYVLAVLSPKERLEAAFSMAREAFRNTFLKLADVEVAVRKVRKKAYKAPHHQQRPGGQHGS